MMQTSAGPYEHSGGYAKRRGHGAHLSISDESHHVTETIGYMYDDDYDKRDSKRLSFLPSPMNESISVTSPPREKSLPPSDSTSHQRPLPIRTSSIDRSGANGAGRQPVPESSSGDRDGGGQVSPVLTRSSSTNTAKSIPMNDIDYESDPAAVAQELSNLAALRRMSMDVGAVDPDLPFNSNFGIPPVPSAPSEEDDASQLFWVPARLHPGLAPKEFKSFLDGKADQLKRRSGEFNISDGGLQIQSSNSGLRRKKSMLSRQIDTPGSKDGTDLDPVTEEPVIDDKPILPPAPPGHSLRRSTRTTYRRGSLRSGERIPHSRRAPRQHDPDAEAVARRSPPSAEEEPPILGLTRVSTDPTSGYSRPAVRSKPTSPNDSPSGTPGESSSDRTNSGTRSTSPPQSQIWSSQTDPNARPRSLEAPPTSQKEHQTAERPSANLKESASTTPASPPSHIPARSSSHDPAPSPSAPTPLPSEPTTSTSRSSKRAGMIRTSKEIPQTISEIASQPAPLPGNSTRTDTLSFIPTLTDTHNHTTKRSDSKKSKDKKDGEGGRKSSWTWLRGSEDKDKSKKRDEEARKSKEKLPKITEKVHDNTRLDVLQTSIDGAQKGRESVVLDRAEIKLEEERRKDSARKSSGAESKKEKETSLFSSIFGGKKKGSQDHGHKKHLSRNLSPEPPPRELKPDIDYNWTRFPISLERDIYRKAHYKLADTKRALHTQVLLSNFMYSYLAKVQQMHPNLNIAGSIPQAQQRKKEQSQSDEYSQHHRRQQSREHDRYNNGPYYNDPQLYDYDGDDRDDQQWSQSGGRGHSQNGSMYGPGHHQQPHSSFADDAQLDDDDDMW
ncbi:hypothetical protein AJ79_05102 [Helicocarpus griseus UAMH5409]|uniref:Protein Zds1 C-terminal domain-containing protein n=1 Tax=Helicocarpus griseus UAMH5409 TaxID=1447875 RepID=A0A2B7XQ16_9EURO|nr:hypothetical protein AJ79_05102 [Helicocarpus griseus UAMH5409]